MNAILANLGAVGLAAVILITADATYHRVEKHPSHKRMLVLLFVGLAWSIFAWRFHSLEWQQLYVFPVAAILMSLVHEFPQLRKAASVASPLPPVNFQALFRTLESITINLVMIFLTMVVADVLFLAFVASTLSITSIITMLREYKSSPVLMAEMVMFNFGVLVMYAMCRKPCRLKLIDFFGR